MHLGGGGNFSGLYAAAGEYGGSDVGVGRACARAGIVGLGGEDACPRPATARAAACGWS